MQTTLLTLRRSIILVIFLGFTFFAKAQKDDSDSNIQTLFGNNTSYGGYGSLAFGYTKLGVNDAFVSSIRGAWLVGHSIGIGFEGTGFISNLTMGNISNESYSFISGGYGGLLVEPIFYAMNPVHFSVPIVIGGGAVVYENSMNNYPSYPDYYYHVDYDQFFVVEPGVEVELNVTRFFRLALGSKYRFTSDIDLTTYDRNDIETQILGSNDLNSFTFYMSFKFGKF